jgi:preprotein translocase subunit SecE
VARDRKRAKQRRGRRGPGRGTAADRAREGAAVPPSKPIRGDLPGSLDHASAEVDEFDAALLRGSGADAASEQDLAAEELDASEAPGDGADVEEEEELEQPAALPAGRGGNGAGAGPPPPGAVAEPGRPAAARPQGNRVLAFLRASWAELQRVQWPDRRQVVQATAVVLGFVAVAGAYLGLADVVAKEIVEFVL